jgi:hypothetical protein
LKGSGRGGVLSASTEFMTLPHVDVRLPRFARRSRAGRGTDSRWSIILRASKRAASSKESVLSTTRFPEAVWADEPVVHWPIVGFGELNDALVTVKEAQQYQHAVEVVRRGESQSASLDRLAYVPRRILRFV